MSDLPYISSEQSELIICTELIIEYTIIQASYTEIRAKRGGGLIIHHGLIIILYISLATLLYPP